MSWLKFGKQRGASAREAPVSIREVTGSEELMSALSEGPAVIYKHSNRCALCFRTLKEVQKFARRHPEVPVLMIDVVKHRSVSNLVADKYHVVHQSPQALVIRDGMSVWEASHLSVTAGELEAAIA